MEINAPEQRAGAAKSIILHGNLDGYRWFAAIIMSSVRKQETWISPFNLSSDGGYCITKRLTRCRSHWIKNEMHAARNTNHTPCPLSLFRIHTIKWVFPQVLIHFFLFWAESVDESEEKEQTSRFLWFISSQPFKCMKNRLRRIFVREMRARAYACGFPQ